MFCQQHPFPSSQEVRHAGRFATNPIWTVACGFDAGFCRLIPKIVFEFSSNPVRSSSRPPGGGQRIGCVVRFELSGSQSAEPPAVPVVIGRTRKGGCEMERMFSKRMALGIFFVGAALLITAFATTSSHGQDKVVVIPLMESSAPAPVEKTGQTRTDRVGDDAYYQIGVPSPAPRFVLLSSYQAVHDKMTDLYWQQSLSSTNRSWMQAIDYCEGLATGSGSTVFNDWRLPNVKEMLSLVDYGRYNPCLPSGHPFVNVKTAYYWTSTPYAAGSPSSLIAWKIQMGTATVELQDKDIYSYAWCVRGGQ